MYNYNTVGICASSIKFDIEDGKLKNICFLGGCDGNLKGLCSLLEGMDVNTVIDKFSGISCGRKSTSCPDQLARALQGIVNNEQN